MIKKLQWQKLKIKCVKEVSCEMNKLIDFSKGLVPVILQHAQTDSVLMLGYMNEEAYQNSERKESNLLL